jgi:uncharacterized membrane protein YfhO
MKTATYLRFSLLLPLLVWGVCLLFMIAVSASPINELLSLESTTITGTLYLFLAFYVFGIVAWVFPYLLLSLVLLALSFIVQARTALKAFALSPIAMTILTLILVNLLTLSGSGNGQILSNPIEMDRGFIPFNLLVLAFSLLWGYICVGTGFGIYKLLQRSQMIRDEVMGMASSPIHQYE